MCKSWDKLNPFSTYFDVDLWYKNGIDRWRNAWAIAPENEGLVLLQHKVCTLVVMCQLNTDTAIHIFLHMNEKYE